MNGFRYYIVIILLSFFAVGSITASAMANCDFASLGQSGASVEKVFYDGTSDQYSAISDHDCHEEGAQHHNPSNGDSDTSNCYDCEGNLCQTQSLVPVLAAHNFFDSSDTIYIDKEINLKVVFLTRILEPPKELS